jgi:hypothetical protein
MGSHQLKTVHRRECAIFNELNAPRLDRTAVFQNCAFPLEGVKNRIKTAFSAFYALDLAAL